MPTEAQRDGLYAAACIAVIVFAAFFGAYAGMPVKWMSEISPQIQKSILTESRDAKMPQSKDIDSSAQRNDAVKKSQGDADQCAGTGTDTTRCAITESDRSKFCFTNMTLCETS